MIHADHTQQQRDDAVKAFREGKTWVLICTELISRGIDFLGVNLVINFDFPSSAISYIHRIGRTGRASRRGRAITYFTQDDKPKLRSIANILKNSGCKVPDYMLTIKKRSKLVRRQLERSAVKREDISVRDPTKKTKKGGLKRKADRNEAGNGNTKKSDQIAAKKRKTTNANEDTTNPSKKQKVNLEKKTKMNPSKAKKQEPGRFVQIKKKTAIVKKKETVKNPTN